MVQLVLLFLAFPIATTGIVYIERFTEDTNPKIGNVSYTYTHDKDGNCVANVAMEVIVTITKIRIYIKVNLPEDQSDQKYRKEILKTVVDLEKWHRGSQNNVLLRKYMEDVTRSMDFELKFPWKPGTYRFINVTLSSMYFPFVQNIPASLDIRAVGRIAGSPSPKFFTQLVFYGGYKQNGN